jgi:ferredoxin
MKDHASCSGCSLCLLACPVWRQTHDIRLTPHGRAKALQHGAGMQDIADSVAQCTLCGTCEPACPENIPLVDLMLELRRAQPLAATTFDVPRTNPAAGSLLLPGKALRGERLARVAGLLSCTVADDDGADLALALETGTPLQADRLRGFLGSLRGAHSLVVADGLLYRSLKDWLPDARIATLGEALSATDAVRSRLLPGDLYVIEPRAFHADHARLIGHYDALRAAKNLATNLDLQRLAIPTTASAAQRALGLPAIDAEDQARWILEGYRFDRVVVEDAADCAVFAAVTDRPVLHLADLA